MKKKTAKTVQEVSAALGVNAETVRRWTREVADFPVVSRGKNGAILLDLAAVKAWHEARLEDRELVMTDPEYVHWRARRMKALALAVEHENAVAQASLKTGEVLRSHMEKCIQHVLATLVLPPLPAASDPAWMGEYSDWHLGLRSWLQTEWLESLDSPPALRDNSLWVCGQFKSFCDTLYHRSSELAHLDKATIAAKLSGWFDGFFASIAQGKSFEQPLAAAVESISQTGEDHA